MMRRIWLFLIDTRTLAILGAATLLALLLLGAQWLELAALWALAAFAAALALWALVWWWRRRRAGRAAAGPQQAGADGAPDAAGSAEAEASGPEELKLIRQSLLAAIDSIRGSRLGRKSGAGALYALPWYLLIGAPGAGKSSAITHSGLQFPLAEAQSKPAPDAGGTRHCDWFFSPDGIVLDTAGRYVAGEGRRAEWLGLLDLLKKHRRKAPINGVVIAVSVAELCGPDPKAGAELARSLRQRVQELIERLEVFAPLYIVFTKADLIAGFGDFFGAAEPAERERVWGATMPYRRRAPGAELLAFFEQSFDELCDGLGEMSQVNMAHRRGARMAPGVFTFPLEFAAIRAPLRAFIATLLEDNRLQFQPVFRGFYFTSARQEGEPLSASAREVGRRFGLTLAEPGADGGGRQQGYFLLDLFRKVIFADQDLVSHYSSRRQVRRRYAAFVGATVALGLCLGGWSWSYLGNRQLVGNVRADLEAVARLQDKRLDLQARLEALEIIADRIVQLEKYRAGRPLRLGMGLYQGEALERKLRDEYFGGAAEVMLKPVVAKLEALLADMNANADRLVAAPRAPAADAPPTPMPALRPRQYQEVQSTSVEDAYNALKTYLMLADKSHAETSHLNDQMARFWRGWLEANRGAMPREQMIRSAERLLSFYLERIDDPAWPRVEARLALVDQARENLRRVVRGMPARERVYADIKARAATRFAPLTVARMVGEQDQALLAGSHAVPGAFTRQAWEKYIEGAFREAANHELQSADWVLKSAARDDLTLEGSPEQIQKGLVALYKADYVREWRQLLQGVAVGELNGLDGALRGMIRLSDPHASPLARLLDAVHRETSWDNPAPGAAELGKAGRGALAWLTDALTRRAPAPVNVNVNLNGGDQAGAPGAPPMGPVSREFAGVARLVASRDKEPTLMRAYLDLLAKLRGRLGQLKNQGDPGPGARQLMQQTLEGGGSELAEALKYVDEQMLAGIGEAQKQALRPLLVRPLMQTFAAIVEPAEAELNKTWQAQVYQPFRQSLATKYPFAPEARIEAGGAEIGQFFGPDGAIAKFVTGAMGPLVVRRGDVLAARTWADMGIRFAPEVAARFPGWIAPLAGGPAQTQFQIQPMPAPGTQEYTVEIDGQQLRYRNTPPQWSSMVHPGAAGAPGARVTALSFDGRSVELFNEPGQFGLKRLIDAAAKKRKDGEVFELSWSSGAITVTVELKIVSSAQEPGWRGAQLPETIVGAAAPPPAPPVLAGDAR